MQIKCDNTQPHNTPTTHTQHHNTHEYSPVAINTEDHTSSATVVVGDFLVAIGSSEASFTERVGVPSSSDEEQAESVWRLKRAYLRPRARGPNSFAQSKSASLQAVVLVATHEERAEHPLQDLWTAAKLGAWRSGFGWMRCCFVAMPSGLASPMRRFAMAGPS